MKFWTLLILILPLLAACGQGEQDESAAADIETAEAVVEAPAEASVDDPCCEVARFSVEGLDMAMAGQLVKALTDMPGVLSAKPAVADGSFSVEFENPTSSPKAILEALQGAGSAVTLLDVVPAEASAGDKSGCAGCPSQSKCQGS